MPNPVVVALSGGVDSAVAAGLLVRQGVRVVGMTMRLYNASGSTPAQGRCCGPRDIEDARRVCTHLGIPFYVVDFEQAFRSQVVDDFARAYLAGETPNPCVRCNQFIKFTPLLRHARALGAERLVTGHYARIDRSAAATPRLLRGVDRHKDQSYFLFSMPAEELESVDFPLGEMTKDEVRALASELGLPNARKAESQEICFVPDGDTAGFVERWAASRGIRPPPGGPVVDTEGREIGRHPGVHHFTIGQRRGLGDLRSIAGSGGVPRYVMHLDAAESRVVVGDRDAAQTRSFWIDSPRWFDTEPRSLHVQVRYRAQPVACRIQHVDDRIGVATESPVLAAPGQSAVFYDGDLVVGGGWISSRPAPGETRATTSRRGFDPEAAA